MLPQAISCGACGAGSEPASDRRREAFARFREAEEQLAACRWCAEDCAADRRHRPAGRCHAGPTARWFSAQTEVADEHELLPAFAVALSGCNLRCGFCVTGEQSWNAGAGLAWTAPEMVRRAHTAMDRGARSVMILGGEPTIHLPTLLEFVSLVSPEARLVLKTNAWFSEPARRLLGGLFDVWLPDFKFGNDRCATRLAGCHEYWARVTRNLQWLANDAGGELIVRHLVMPGHVDCCWLPIARWIAAEMPCTRVSLRNGFWPAWKSDRFPELRRVLGSAEWARARDVAAHLDLQLVP